MVLLLKEALKNENGRKILGNYVILELTKSKPYFFDRNGQKEVPKDYLDGTRKVNESVIFKRKR